MLKNRAVRSRAVEVRVDAPQFLLHRDEVPQHSVKRMAEFLELVTGANVSAHIELAVRDRVADLLQVHDGLGHDVSQDQVDRDDRQHDLQQLGRDHEGVGAGQRRPHAVER